MNISPDQNTSMNDVKLENIPMSDTIGIVRQGIRSVDEEQARYNRAREYYIGVFTKMFKGKKINLVREANIEPFICASVEYDERVGGFTLWGRSKKTNELFSVQLRMIESVEDDKI